MWWALTLCRISRRGVILGESPSPEMCDAKQCSKSVELAVRSAVTVMSRQFSAFLRFEVVWSKHRPARYYGQQGDKRQEYLKRVIGFRFVCWCAGEGCISSILIEECRLLFGFAETQLLGLRFRSSLRQVGQLNQHQRQPFSERRRCDMTSGTRPPSRPRVSCTAVSARSTTMSPLHGKQRCHVSRAAMPP